MENLLRPAAPISFPLTSLEQLDDRSYFSYFHLPFNQCSVPLSTSRQVGSQEKRPRLLVCHDMKGGYQDDKWVQGNQNSEAYSLWHWHLIDIFVYFSHSLVTLPPPCWTNAAHKHGVQVLGTFITEWSEGKDLCKRMLASKKSAHMYASRLSELAAVLGFDGWLINIENEVEKNQLDNLLEFVKQLTILMHKLVPCSVVIWYDSVTKNGHLEWQDCLNDMNKCFFDLCDGIFTNYTWKAEDPLKSALKAGERNHDVYMGVDVFGRGTFGGGGFKTNVALKAAREAGVSAALFAPSWVYETEQGPSFPAAQNRLWGLVADCWSSAQQYPVHLPFFSSFDQGFGKEMYIRGKKVSAVPWSNISCQNLQPLLHIETVPKDGIFESVINGEQPLYSGGASVKFFGEIGEQTYCLTVLYEADIVLTNVPLLISYTVQCTSNSCFSLLFKMHDQNGVIYNFLVGPEEAANNEIYAHHNSRLAFKLPNKEYQVQGSEGEWSFREYTMEVNGKIEGIFAVSYLHKLNLERILNLCKDIPFTRSLSEASAAITTEVNTSSLYQAFLGHVGMSNFHIHEAFHVVSFNSSKISWDNVSGQRTVSLLLTWVIEDNTDTQIAQYNIYVSAGFKINEEPEHLGVAVVKSFYVSHLPVGEECKALTFYLQMCCECGISSSLENGQQTSILVPSAEGTGSMT